MAKRLLPSGMRLVGIVTICLLAHPATAASQATPDMENRTSLLDTLQHLVSQLRTQRQDYYRQKARKDAEIQRFQENAALLQTQLDELHRQEAQLDEQIQEYQSEIQTLVIQRAAKSPMRRVVAQHSAAFIARQATRIETGIPYRQPERLARLRAGATDPNEMTQLSAAGQLSHLWSYAREELRLAGSAETYSDRASAEDDVTPYARYFRIGQWMLGYVTEDGAQTALWLSALGGGAWQPITEPGQAARVRSAVEILDRRRAPDFVSLPTAPATLNPNWEAP